VLCIRTLVSPTEKKRIFKTGETPLLIRVNVKMRQEGCHSPVLPGNTDLSKFNVVIIQATCENTGIVRVRVMRIKSPKVSEPAG
jgi:hypothetical protein